MSGLPAAAFCYTLLSSAKPVAIFARVADTAAHDPRDLLRLSAARALVSAGLVMVFSLFVWPLLGLPYVR
ncbi:MAG: transporter [Pseudonocardia sp.]|jgi:sodium-dependent dicarboxylate transporter 2/3/5|nr:transporter [Pseudonocardia sp.]